MSFITETLLQLDFSSQAGYYFRNWEYSLTDAQKPLTYTLSLILAFSVVFLAYSLYRRWFAQKPPLFSTSKPSEITAIFQQAVAERATHEIQFQGESGQRTVFSCAPADFDASRGVILEVSSYIHPQKNWIGRGVLCHFKLNAANKDQKWSFFQFTSTIVDIRREDVLEFIVVALPELLERKQRRQHLRLDPPSEDIPALSLWPETLGNLDHPGEHPPMLFFVHGSPDNQLNVLNISGGGLLLEVRPTARDILDNSLDKGKRLFVSVSLRDPDQDTIATYLLLARIRNVFTDPVTGSRLIGLSFTAYQALREKPEDERWTPLQGKGLEEIEDWVFKRHLQIYRQKGIV